MGGEEFTRNMSGNKLEGKHVTWRKFQRRDLEGGEQAAAVPQINMYQNHRFRCMNPVLGSVIDRKGVEQEQFLQ